MIPFQLRRLCQFPPRLMALSDNLDKRRFSFLLKVSHRIFWHTTGIRGLPQ